MPERDMTELSEAVIASSEFRHLLWLAMEIDDAELERIVQEELPRLAIHGITEDGVVTAFVAFDQRAVPVIIEYIAVSSDARGKG
ncbi:MAG: hypothetical protein H7287_05545, partial [Thermoleophilia bacterium]|nr:hypothetical protein [Thermoleophilia bacterium]